MKKLNATERQMQIINLLNKNGAMKTLDLANYFHVSRETMRRDLLALTEQGLIDKWFGGVICADQLTQHPVIYEDKLGFRAVIRLPTKRKFLCPLPKRNQKPTLLLRKCRLHERLCLYLPLVPPFFLTAEKPPSV